MDDLFHNALSQVNFLLANIPLKGETVVDATVGNGNDTLFLAQAVGNLGKVYAFDIQRIALEKTKQLLDIHNITWYNLIHDDHQNLDCYNIQAPMAVVFNLGYLPGGDHLIITKPASTVAAISKALAMLKIGGILTVVIYTGHDQGKEAENLYHFFSSLPRQYDVLHFAFLNRANNPPYLVAVRKLMEV